MNDLDHASHVRSAPPKREPRRTRAQARERRRAVFSIPISLWWRSGGGNSSSCICRCFGVDGRVEPV
jgi:hypothetical protein